MKRHDLQLPSAVKNIDRRIISHSATAFARGAPSINAPLGANRLHQVSRIGQVLRTIARRFFHSIARAPWSKIMGEFGWMLANARFDASPIVTASYSALPLIFIAGVALKTYLNMPRIFDLSKIPVPHWKHRNG